MKMGWFKKKEVETFVVSVYVTEDKMASYICVDWTLIDNGILVLSLVNGEKVLVKSWNYAETSDE
jgi:hypothetical protein